MTKTFSLKSADVKRAWVLFDASKQPVGRLATEVARRLTGKYQPQFTPHVDSGDFVVIINADSLVMTANKDLQKKYRHYSGYPSGIKEKTLEQVKAENPTKVIEAAVYGMLPKNKLRADRMARLKVYTDDKHPHDGQKPQTIGDK